MTVATMMTAVVQDKLGAPDVLHLAEVPRPTPGIGQVLVRVHAAGVNPVDAMNRQTGAFTGPPPFVLGFDVSGVVEAVGPGVTILAPGDEVFGLLPFPHGSGAYAEYVLAPARALIEKPASLSHEQAAALPLAGLTAWQALVETAGLRSGERVVITGASGGVGHLAVQIAAARGAQVIAFASARNADIVRELGADDVLDYEASDLTELREVDVVLDVLGGETPAKAVQALRPGGRLVSTLPQGLAAATAAARAKDIEISGLFVEADRLGLRALADLVAEQRLRPVIAAVYPLADAASAHSGGHAPGKVVLRVS